MNSSRVVIGVAAGVFSTVILGCVYFDWKRHKDPEFKKKLHQRRAAQKLKESAAMNIQELDMTDIQDVHMFFLKEIQLGEQLLAAGDLENGVQHLGNAVAVCGQPNQLLSVLQNTLPPVVFQLLVQRLPLITPRMQKSEERLQHEDLD